MPHPFSLRRRMFISRFIMEAMNNLHFCDVDLGRCCSCVTPHTAWLPFGREYTCAYSIDK
jgi:hypothetical protein